MCKERQKVIRNSLLRWFWEEGRGVPAYPPAVYDLAQEAAKNLGFLADCRKAELHYLATGWCLACCRPVPVGEVPLAFTEDGEPVSASSAMMRTFPAGYAEDTEVRLDFIAAAGGCYVCWNHGRTALDKVQEDLDRLEWAQA